MKLICPRCGQSITANASWAGSMVNCPKCGKKIAVPEGVADDDKSAARPSAEKPKSATTRPATKPASPAAPKSPEKTDVEKPDDDLQLAPAEKRPKMHLTEDELTLAPEQPRPKTETLLESAPAPKEPPPKTTPRPRPAPAAKKKPADASAAPVKPERERDKDDCPNCGAPLPPDGMLCTKCGYHLILKRVLQTDLRDMAVDTTTGFQRWLNNQLSEGESFSSMLWLLHGVMLIIAVALGLMFHPGGWVIVVPAYCIYFLFVLWARKSRVYLRWGDAIWNRMLRRRQRNHWKGLRAFISYDRGFDDNALGEVPNLEELEVLDLQGTSITDEALQHIQYCPALKYIVVKGTRMTPKGVERLQIMMPDASIWS